MNRKTTEDPNTLRRRLARLGGKPLSHPTRGKPSAGGERLGRPIEMASGTAHVIEERFPLAHAHGRRKLNDLMDLDSGLASEIAHDPSLAELELTQLLFVDTETTGLVGGAGTIAFLIGIGAYERDEFVLRQFFLHEPGEEAAMLQSLRPHLDAAKGFISFNGRAFDIPLMEMRYQMSLRTRLVLSSWPHLDLLFPSRRLWRRSLPDCSLGTLEANILGVERSDQDVPGAWIPGMYLDYLRTGNLTELKRVIYHNREDILSLVGLAVEIFERHEPGTPALSGSEALGIARWHQNAGRSESANEGFQAAIKSKDKQIQVEALRHYAAHLKRRGERASALEFWRQWHSLAVEDPAPCIELAMFYEWHEADIDQAAFWSREALICLSHWPADWRREKVWAEIEHRIERLARKTSRDN